jgi:uncharacterized membrane protein
LFISPTKYCNCLSWAVETVTRNMLSTRNIFKLICNVTQVQYMWNDNCFSYCSWYKDITRIIFVNCLGTWDRNRKWMYLSRNLSIVYMQFYDMGKTAIALSHLVHHGRKQTMRNNVLSDFGYKGTQILHRNCPGTKAEQTIIIQTVR